VGGIHGYGCGPQGTRSMFVLNEVLEGEGFDAFCREVVRKVFMPRKLGRPGLTPGIYFRSLMIG